jgi:beta-glucosidase
VDLAKKADVVLMFVGLSPGIDGSDGESGESEGTDRCQAEGSPLSLPGLQSELVAQVAAANPNVVLVLIHGSMSLSLENERALAPAILDAHYPGQMGGDALASILFGDVSPAGRLTTTIYPDSMTTKRNISDMGLREKGGITYQHYTGAPNFRCSGSTIYLIAVV